MLPDWLPTWYLLLKISTAAACDRIILWAATKGSFSESPSLQFPNGLEQRAGGYIPER